MNARAPTLRLAEMTAVTLKDRNRRPELMDDADLDPLLHEQALAGLRRLNQFSGSTGIVWSKISRLARQSRRTNELRVLDIGCGGGDIAVAVARRARRAGLQVHVDGADISPVAVRHSRELAQRAGASNVGFFELDVLGGPVPTGYDVIMCSLFLHHLSEADAVELLRKMAEAARQAVLVNDLRRTRMGYTLAWLGCRLLSRSPIVHVDGPRSVAGAFSIAEIRTMAEQGGLAGASITQHWPQRFLLTWSRP